MAWNIYVIFLVPVMKILWRFPSSSDEDFMGLSLSPSSGSDTENVYVGKRKKSIKPKIYILILSFLLVLMLIVGKMEKIWRFFIAITFLMGIVKKRL